MGQKVHPGGLRVGVIHDWKSNWFAGPKEFSSWLIEDVRIRDHIYGKLAHAGLSDILIRKDKQRVTVDIYTARPGIVIGKSGVEVDALRRELHAITHKNVHININEIKRPELDAKLVAQSVAEQLQNRVSFRRAMKRALASAIRSGAQGIKIVCSGRLGGTEMSRSESYSEGRVPLHTIRADIDYGFTEARTTFGRIGVKVWINKGEIMPEGYEGLQGGRESRLGEQDQARRRGAGGGEGLAGAREGGRGRGVDREGLGPVRQRRRSGSRGSGQRPARPRTETAEQPTEAQAVAKAQGAAAPIEALPTTPAEQPKAMAEKPKAAAEKPKPEKAKAAVEKPKVAAEKPKAAAEKPKPEKAKAATAKPKAAAEKPKTAAEKPKPEKAKAATAKPKTAAEKPKSAAKGKVESAADEKPKKPALKRAPRKKTEAEPKAGS
ncbi:MAG: 30S ribosomal protein S3 [Gaiellaceae bacterium]|jgi:small subunit ribosomal protein S3